VTVAVGPLSATEIQDALDSGSAFAEVLRGQGLIEAAALVLGTQACVVRNR